MKGVLLGLWVFGVGIAYYLAGNGGISVSALGIDQGNIGTFIVSNGISAAIDLGAGALGIYGSNRPTKILPFLVINAVAFWVDVVGLAAGVVLHESLDAVSVQGLLDMLYVGACTWLSLKVYKQPAR